MEILRALVEIIFILLESVLITLKDAVKIVRPDWFYKDVRGELVLITGGGHGIGRIVAEKLAKRGAIIVSLDINKEGNEETVRNILENGGKAKSYICDLTNKESCYEVAERVKHELGHVSILINNAGIVNGAPLLQTNDDRIKKCFETNVLAHFWMIKAFLPDMIERKKGHLVDVASLAGFFGMNQLTDYCSSKFAAIGLSEALRAELHSQGHSEYIQCTSIAPYFINTGMFDGVQSKFVPIITPEYMGQEIMNGVLTEKDYVIIPRFFVVFMILKTIFPISTFIKLSKTLGFSSSMKNFHK